MKRKAHPGENERNIRPEIRDDSSAQSSSHLLLSLMASCQQQPPPLAQSILTMPTIGGAPPVGSTISNGLTANAITALQQGLQSTMQPQASNPEHQVLAALLQQFLSVPTNAGNGTPFFVPSPAIQSQQWPIQPQISALSGGIQAGTTATDSSAATALQNLIQLLQPLISAQLPAAPGPTYLPTLNPAVLPVSTPQLVPNVSQSQLIGEDPMSMVNRDMQLANDAFYLPKYQAYLRSHLEFFATDISEANTTAQGRKRKIRHQQVGIRCRHCSDIPVLLRGKGAV